MCNMIEYCSDTITILLKRIDKSRLNVTEFENNKETKLLKSIKFLILNINNIN